MILEQEATRQDIALLTKTSSDLEKGIKDMEKIYFQIEIHPLVIENDQIHIIQSNTNEYDFSSLPSPNKRIDYSKESSAAMTNSHRFLLLHIEPNLCLINQESVVVQQKPWNYGRIYDMCWSPALVQFISITNDGLFLIDEKTLAITKVQINPNVKLGSCTCSDDALYVTTWEYGSSIFKYELLPSIQWIQEWQSQTICTCQEIIQDMTYSDDALAILIKDKSTKTLSLELRSSKTLELVWSCPLSIKYHRIFKFHCCLVNQDG
ncbi:unnamed protein product [Rotaria sordida]|uniref:Uncharacterized protein n=1 Tax=Rotaria sordida TaxID=392033 RepID=A0A816EFL4_9BILA|nr:unnamed protein product [Rotaria sordida]CAF1645931.1 unnamed protein product [Rotaria sordida]